VAELPSGTVTFLFTDVEGSTRLWEEYPEAMQPALARHDAILDEAVVAHDGHVVKRTGDGVHAVFATAEDALRAAAAAQLALGGEPWGRTGRLRVRMGLHSGAAQSRDGDYFGSVTNRAARLMAIAHGDQIVVSHATAELVGDASLDPITLVDLGEFELRDLARKIRVLQLCHPGLEQLFPPLRALDSFHGNLPIQTTGFVGRSRELLEVANALEDARVVTLTGVGGVGKTRVALQVGADVLPRYPGGVWLCELASVGAAEAVVESIAGSLRVQPQVGQTLHQSLLEFLGSRHVLLIFDNCEHLLDPVARLVDEVVHHCSEVTVLATSREGLALPGERIVALPSLRLPRSGVGGDPDAAMSSDAVMLFVERAFDARSDFELDDQNVDAVVQVCERLDGIPLAIELAAACVQAMTPAEIAARLDDQFRLLSAGRRTSVERHQTLRRAIDWSYDLLAPDERRVLQRLAVFAGGFTLAAAEVVVASDLFPPFDVLENLVALVRRSLLVADTMGDKTRYRLLETIRQYGQDRLEEAGDADTTRDRHAAYYAAFVAALAPELRDARQLAALAHLDPEIANLRAAFSWALDGGALDVALQIVTSVAVNGTTIGDTALSWAELAAAVPTIDVYELGPAVLGHATWSAVRRGDIDRARELDSRRRDAEVALGLPPRPANHIGPFTIALFSGQTEEAVEWAREHAALARAAGDTFETVSALTALGAALVGDDPESAWRVLTEAVEEGRRLGNPSALSWALLWLGSATDDPVQAIESYSESADLAAATGNQQVLAPALGGLAYQQTRLGDATEGLEAMVEAAERGKQSGNVYTLSLCLAQLAVLLGELGRHKTAVVLLAGADRLGGQIRYSGVGAEARSELFTAATAVLGRAGYEELRRRGAAMSDDELIAEAHAGIQEDTEN